MTKYIWTRSESSPPVKISLFFFFSSLFGCPHTHMHTQKLNLSSTSPQRLNSVWKQQFLSWINRAFFSFLFTVYVFVHRWKLNDSFIHLRPGLRYSLMGGNLHISRLNKDEDVGIYQCLASNSFGTIVSREASLHIACECSVCSAWPSLNHFYIILICGNIADGLACSYSKVWVLLTACTREC